MYLTLYCLAGAWIATLSSPRSGWRLRLRLVFPSYRAFWYLLFGPVKPFQSRFDMLANMLVDGCPFDGAPQSITQRPNSLVVPNKI